jgi:hypothetical protein
MTRGVPVPSHSAEWTSFGPLVTPIGGDGPPASIYRKGDSMKAQFHTVVLVALAAIITGALIPIDAPAAQIKECRAAVPAKAQGHWSWRLIDGRKCWYAGRTAIAKSSLRWPAAAQAKAPAQVQAKAPTQDRAQAAPVSIFNDKRSDLMNAQARMIDEPNTFEARWRARVTIE